MMATFSVYGTRVKSMSWCPTSARAAYQPQRPLRYLNLPTCQAKWFKWAAVPQASHSMGSARVGEMCHWRVLLLTLLFQCVVWSQHVDPGEVEGRQRINTVTTTVITTRTTTTTRTFSTVCAKLINVTGPCIARRGRWIEEPQILVFDEELHDEIEHVFDPSFVHLVEVTPVPVLDVPTQWNSHVTPETTLQPSIEGRVKRPPEASAPEERIYFSQLAQLISFFVSPFLPASTLTVTSTSTRTSTVTSRTTSTSTIFIQVCTPSNFPYSQCPKRK